ncbi:1-aminocyclopropane-1-carboxylate deaminase/D-cysteine desulfhydrase [Apibacter sp.]|uniref:1-aminocyclopropane-1-carboxylate deaminase/D-cysteine desulfhydrase n=1 Tax=Apibacter sp. TaxID=2023709 RepID=UPI0025D9CE02|nr:pyridoxal-phosphate dependent enzyme [Apibacter sp.]MCT6868613.1 pyridoxal-phosphate dependent enzyme [Apibacter sp.]
MSTPIQTFQFPGLQTEQILHIKREDMIHPVISGNKFWKLKYNLIKAKDLGKQILVTFGGAMSNHIVACAAAAQANGFQSIGIIRGEEIVEKWKENITLTEASEYGMKFFFVPRQEYRLKEKSKYIQNILDKIPNYYLVPEGGTNTLAVKGASEILSEETYNYDIITSAMGTGGTLAGLSVGAKAYQLVIGFPVLKNAHFLVKELLKYTHKKNFIVNLEYHFGGYAKITTELIDFINEFYYLNNIPLDPVYTGKMMFGLRDMIKKGQIDKDKKILAVHTGGLQGIKEMNKYLSKKSKPIIVT